MYIENTRTGLDNCVIKKMIYSHADLKLGLFKHNKKKIYLHLSSFITNAYEN